MDSTRPIRALMRGLDALTVLNRRDGATVSEVAQEVRLPRTTVYRILETLLTGGFVFRDETDDRYRLTVRVRGLSGGFGDEAWVSRIAKPFIHDLCRNVVWPVSISTLSGITMQIRESTDHATPLAMDRYSAGFRTPLLTTAQGRVYLANAPPAQREALIERLAKSALEADESARRPADLLRSLTQVRTSGYAAETHTRRLVEEVNLSVPVLVGDRVLASLSMRFASPAVPLKIALERFLPRLRRCAADIGTQFSEQQAEARAIGAPQAAA